MTTTYAPTHDPRVTAVIDLFTDALIAASRQGSSNARYLHGAPITREQVDEASHTAHNLQVAAQNAIYALATALAADSEQVAS